MAIGASGFAENLPVPGTVQTKERIMGEKAIKEKELIIDIKNRPGAASEVLAILAQEKINVTAMVGYCSPSAKTKAWLHVLCKDPVAAKKALTREKYKSKFGDVVVINVPNRLGYMAAVMDKAASKNVNFEHAYGSTIGKTGIVVLGTRTAAKAVKAFNA